MKRTGIRRGTSELKRTPMKQSRKRLPARNAKRSAWKFERNFWSFERVEFTKLQPCAVCMEVGTKDNPVENAHHVARGMGGCGGNYLDIIPLCKRHHDEQGDAPKTFWTDRNMDPVELAHEHQLRWEAWAEMWGYAA